MSVIVWLLIPIAAVVVAMVWTAMLARHERRRADEKWRAARMAELGGVLVTDTGLSADPPEPATAGSEDSDDTAEGDRVESEPAGLAETEGRSDS